MRHIIFKYYLRLRRKLAKFRQVGNPYGKAPAFIADPDAKHEMRMPHDFSNNVSAWRFYDTICSSQYGGAVIDKDNQVYGSLCQFPWGNDLHPSLSSPFLGKPVSAIDKGIFLITPEAKGNFYHWMADLLPRLLLIKKVGLSDFHDRYIILHHPAKSYETDTLSLLSIPNNKIVRLQSYKTVKVNDLVVADYSSNENLFPDWKKKLLNEFKNDVLGNFRAQGSTKVYLLRGKQKKRCLIGEEYLISTLRENGFQIIDPQYMTLLDQIRTLASASVVVGVHGAALTNIMFCRESTHVIELRSIFNPPEFYSVLAKAYKLRFESINLHPEHKHSKMHLSNKQNLILSRENVEELTLKLHQTL